MLVWNLHVVASVVNGFLTRLTHGGTQLSTPPVPGRAPTAAPGSGPRTIPWPQNLLLLPPDRSQLLQLQSVSRGKTDGPLVAPAVRLHTRIPLPGKQGLMQLQELPTLGAGCALDATPGSALCSENPLAVQEVTILVTGHLAREQALEVLQVRKSELLAHPPKLVLADLLPEGELGVYPHPFPIMLVEETVVIPLLLPEPLGCQ